MPPLRRRIFTAEKQEQQDHRNWQPPRDFAWGNFARRNDGDMMKVRQDESHGQLLAVKFSQPTQDIKNRRFCQEKTCGWASDG
jgi:hypothetical protein